MKERLIDCLIRAGWLGAPDEADLHAAGLDSLILVLWVSEIERAFGIRVPPAFLTRENFKNVDAVGDLVARLVADLKLGDKQ